MNIPHKLVLLEDRGEVCVADRENGRVQCYSAQNGEFVQTIQPAQFGSRIFGIAYASKILTEI